MNEISFIKNLKSNCKSDNGNVFEDLMNHVHNTLKMVDEFQCTIYSDVFELKYLSDNNLSQLEIGLELGISTSCVCKIIKKIDDYILELIRNDRYITLVNKETKA